MEPSLDTPTMLIQPTVTIIIPVYNGSKYLREAIDSALGQTYPNVEVIVVNDGSDDNGATEAVARSYGNRVRYFYKENGGVSTALNLGIREMNGDWVSWLSHDDAYKPDKIAKQMELLAQEQGKVIPYTHIKYIDELSSPIDTYNYPPVAADKFVMEMLKENFIYGCSLLVPREAFDKVGLFNEALRTTPDYEMWLRLCKRKYRFKNIPEPLVLVRLHAEMVTFKRENLLFKQIEEVIIWALAYFEAAELFPAGLSDSAGYAALALEYKEKGYKQAYRHAMRLASLNITKSGYRQKIKDILSIIHGTIWQPFLSVTLWKRKVIKWLNGSTRGRAFVQYIVNLKSTARKSIKDGKS
jgi:glycosyltransferase involved in cell wall biosynthesis